MDESCKLKPLIFVVGPTGVGKSRVSLELCGQHGGAIFNADSLQIYQSLDIGTAKPSLEETSLCPHFLFDIASSGERWTVGDYCRRAWPELTQWRRQIPAFVVGGSGFYIQALEKGLFPVGEVKPQVKAQVEEIKSQGPKALYQALMQQDPEYAAQIFPQDLYRVERGLETVLNENKTMSEIRREFAGRGPELGEPIFKVGLRLSREKLRKSLKSRLEVMLRQGWVAEVEGLLAQGLEDWPALQSVGYRQVVGFLRGEITEFEEMKSQIVIQSMQLAKKQMTWFRRDPSIHWYDLEQEGSLAQLISQVDRWLAGPG